MLFEFMAEMLQLTLLNLMALTRLLSKPPAKFSLRRYDTDSGHSLEAVNNSKELSGE